MRQARAGLGRIAESGRDLRPIIESYREFGPVESIGMLLGLTFGAVILTWLYNRSGGSLLLVIVRHGVDNIVCATEGLSRRPPGSG